MFARQRATMHIYTYLISVSLPEFIMSAPVILSSHTGLPFIKVKPKNNCSSILPEINNCLKTTPFAQFHINDMTEKWDGLEDSKSWVGKHIYCIARLQCVTNSLDTFAMSGLGGIRMMALATIGTNKFAITYESHFAKVALANLQKHCSECSVAIVAQMLSLNGVMQFCRYVPVQFWNLDASYQTPIHILNAILELCKPSIILQANIPVNELVVHPMYPYKAFYNDILRKHESYVHVVVNEPANLTFGERKGKQHNQNRYFAILMRTSEQP